MHPTISFIIPMHNESGNCEQLVNEIQTCGDSLPDQYEILCVDDASTDNTLSILHKLQQQITELNVIALVNNCGQSTALFTGVRQAHGKIIVTLDGDGQNNPADVPAMLNLLHEKQKENICMIAGWRKKRKDTFWRRLSSKVANSVRCFLLCDSTPDTGCGLKVFYRETFMALPWFDHMHRFLPSLVQRGGGRVLSVEVSHRPRQYGTSHYGTLDRLRVGIVDLFGVAWLQRRNKLPQIKYFPGENQ